MLVLASSLSVSSAWGGGLVVHVGAFFTDLLSELLLRATHAAAVCSPASRHRDYPLAIAVADMERR